MTNKETALETKKWFPIATVVIISLFIVCQIVSVVDSGRIAEKKEALKISSDMFRTSDSLIEISNEIITTVYDSITGDSVLSVERSNEPSIARAVSDSVLYQEKRAAAEDSIDAQSVKAFVGLHTRNMNILSVFLYPWFQSNWVTFALSILFFAIIGVSMERFWGKRMYSLVVVTIAVLAGAVYLLLSSVLDIAKSQIYFVGATPVIFGLLAIVLAAPFKRSLQLPRWMKHHRFTLETMLAFWAILFAVVESIVAVVTHSLSMSGFVTCVVSSGIGFVILQLILFYPERKESRKRKAVVSQGNNEYPDTRDTDELLRQESRAAESITPAEIDQTTQNCIDRITGLLVDPKGNYYDLYHEISKIYEYPHTVKIGATLFHNWAAVFDNYSFHYLAIICFELAARGAPEGNFFRLNSLLRASQLRIEIGKSVELAVEMLQTVVREGKSEAMVLQAQEILISLENEKKSAN